MLSIETKKEPTTNVSPIAKGKRKSRIGILSYLKHSFIGCLVAVASFSTALAMQPAIASEDGSYRKYSPAMVADATEEDLAILETHMDESILLSVKEKTDEPGEIIALYVQKDTEFAEILENYFN